ncbi:Lipoprotein signal peptidase [bacterium HR09]|nr:Lipoprotein signal peptidase [bacterium HR09]
MGASSVRAFFRTLGLAGAVVALDQLSKLWLVASLPYGTQKTVVPGFFDLVHTRNRGVAFGLFSQAGPWSQAVLLVLVVALVGFVAWQLFLQRHRWAARVGLSLIFGGALGNLADRLLRGEVVDFLDFYLSWGGRSYHWPAFNVADASITLGALWLLAFELFFAKVGGHASNPR